MAVSTVAAHNASMQMEYLAKRFLNDKIPARLAVIGISVEYDKFLEAIKDDAPANADALARVTFALGVGMKAATVALSKRGPVMVRWVDPDGIHELLFPNGPPPGMGG